MANYKTERKLAQSICPGHTICRECDGCQTCGECSPNGNGCEATCVRPAYDPCPDDYDG